MNIANLAALGRRACALYYWHCKAPRGICFTGDLKLCKLNCLEVTHKAVEMPKILNAKCLLLDSWTVQKKMIICMTLGPRKMTQYFSESNFTHWSFNPYKCTSETIGR